MESILDFPEMKIEPGEFFTDDSMACCIKDYTIRQVTNYDDMKDLTSGGEDVGHQAKTI